MNVTFVKYYKRVSIWQEIERNKVEIFRSELNTIVSFYKMNRLHQGQYDHIEAYGKQTAYDEREEIIVSE